MIKEIEKLEHATPADAPFDVANATIDKINEIIKVVNALLITHPRLEESADKRREFERLVKE